MTRSTFLGSFGILVRPDYPDRQNDWSVMAAAAFDGYDLAG